MAASSRGFATPFTLRRGGGGGIRYVSPFHRGVTFEVIRRRNGAGGGEGVVRCCCPDPVTPIGIKPVGAGKGGDLNSDEWRFDKKKSARRVRRQALPSMPFASQSRFVKKQEKFSPRCTPKNTGPQSRDTPPKRDTGIAKEKDWGISLLNEHVSESGTNEDGSTWYRESGEDLGENGYRCRWTRMGGLSHDGTSEWKEMVLDEADGMLDMGFEQEVRSILSQTSSGFC